MGCVLWKNSVYSFDIVDEFAGLIVIGVWGCCWVLAVIGWFSGFR